MSIENLKEALPEYAKDLKLNLGTVARGTVLSQKPALGHSRRDGGRHPKRAGVQGDSRGGRGHSDARGPRRGTGRGIDHGDDQCLYRGRGFLDGAYDDLRPGLRMNIIGNPGVDKSEFELWSFAVSTINGCHYCVGSHEKVLREAGLTREQVLEALKIAAIVAGVAQALATVPALV